MLHVCCDINEIIIVTSIMISLTGTSSTHVNYWYHLPKTVYNYTMNHKNVTFC